MRKEWGWSRQSQRWTRFDHRLSCLTVFTLVEGLLLHAWRLSYHGDKHERSMEGIPKNVADEALLILELWLLPHKKRSLLGYHHRLLCPVESFWLPRSQVSGGEEKVFDVSLIFVKEFHEHPPRSLDSGLNNKVYLRVKCSPICRTLFPSALATCLVGLDG